MKGHAASIGRQHIQRAYERIKSYIRETPIVALGPHPQLTEADVVLKLELLQHAGSFKTRGAFNNLLSERVPPAGVIAASGGNHGVAVAFAAQRLGQVAEIFVPMISSPVKIDRIRKYGAKVTIVGANYAEALEAGLARATETGARSSMHMISARPSRAQEPSRWNSRHNRTGWTASWCRSGAAD